MIFVVILGACCREKNCCLDMWIGCMKNCSLELHVDEMTKLDFCILGHTWVTKNLRFVSV